MFKNLDQTDRLDRLDHDTLKITSWFVDEKPVLKKLIKNSEAVVGPTNLANRSLSIGSIGPVKNIFSLSYFPF